MSILGSLVISLQAETASFLSGMTGASKTARQTGREIEDSFSRLGDVAGKALAPFGEFGRVIGETLGTIGDSAGGAIAKFGALGGSLGALSAVGAGAGATMLAVAGASAALATHTAETISKMYELAQSTGVSVKDLSAFGFAANAVGISTESLGKGMEKMNKSVFAAAIAAPGTINAFTRLGVSVKDAEGQIRPTRDILLDLAEKFAALPAGPAKGALAMQIFGKAGAEMIPFLNQGRDGIEEMLAKAKEFGVELDSKTAKAAHEFTVTLNDLQAEGQGLAISLTRQLLPALQTVAEAMRDTNKSSTFGDLVTGMVVLTKGVLIAADYIISSFRNIAIVVSLVLSELTEGAIGLARVAVDAAQLNWQKMSFDAKDAAARIGGVWDNFQDEQKRNWQNLADFTNELSFGPTKPVNPLLDKNPLVMGKLQQAKDAASRSRDDTSGISSQALATGLGIHGEFADPFIAQGILGSFKKTPTDVTAGKDKNTALERIKARIAELQKETIAWQAVGAAGSQAEALIAEAGLKGDQVFGKLLEEAGRDKGQKGIATALVMSNEALIKGAAAAEIYGKAIKAVGDDLSKQGLKLDEQDKAALALSEAYRQGGAAIANAALGKQFAEQAAKLDVLARTHDILAQKLGKEAPAVKELAEGLRIQTAALEENKAKAQQLASDDLNVSFEKQINSFKVLSPLVQNLSEAYLQSQDAVRRNRIELELANFVLAEQDKGVLMSASAIATKRALLQEADNEAYQGALLQEAAQFSLSALYDNQIVKLQRVREVVQQYGQSTILVDAALYDSQTRLIQQWDEAAIKASTFGNRVHAVFNELVIQGKQAGETISKAFIGAFDGLETELAKLIVTGKSNFLSVLQSLEQSIVKAGIQKALGAAIGGIPGLSNIAKLLGGGQQLGTEQNPMIVRFQNGFLGGIGGGSSALPFSAGGAPTAIPGVVGAVGGESLGLPTGIFTQQLNTMAAAQAVFAGKMGGSWTGIVGMFRGAIGLMMGLFHIHTAGMIAGQAAQTGAAVASQAAQTGAASAGAGARSNIGFAEHMKKIFQHASSAAAGAYSAVFDSGIPFPINAILAPIAAAGAFAGVLAWGAIGSAAKGALVPEDMLMMTHKNEMVIPGDISEGLQGIIRANQGGFAPSVSDFGGPQRGGAGDEFHAHVHMGNVTAMDTVGIAEQIKKARHQVLKEVRQGFSTGYLNGRRMARV